MTVSSGRFDRDDPVRTRVPAWAAISILALPTAWLDAAWTSAQLDSSPTCVGDAPLPSCTVDGGFAAVVVITLSVVAAVAAAVLRARRNSPAEWVVAIAWLIGVVGYAALRVAG